MSTLVVVPDQRWRPGRRQRRAERRRLRRVDTLSARLAELHAIGVLLDGAADVVEHGWVQGGWFAVATAQGGHRRLSAYDVHLAESRPVTGACLVGAVVHAAGGPSTVRSQLVQRTLDLAWHTLRDEPGRRVRWCPGPDVRALHVLDLTHWNDAPGRTQGDVQDFLVAVRKSTEVERDECLTALAELTLAEPATV